MGLTKPVSRRSWNTVALQIWSCQNAESSCVLWCVLGVCGFGWRTRDGWLASSFGCRPGVTACSHARCTGIHLRFHRAPQRRLQITNHPSPSRRKWACGGWVAQFRATRARDKRENGENGENGDGEWWVASAKRGQIPISNADRDGGIEMNRERESPRRANS